jgi:hypothetical protein
MPRLLLCPGARLSRRAAGASLCLARKVGPPLRPRWAAGPAPRTLCAPRQRPSGGLQTWSHPALSRSPSMNEGPVSSPSPDVVRVLTTSHCDMPGGCGDFRAALATQATFGALVALLVERVRGRRDRGLHQSPAQISRAVLGQRPASVHLAGLAPRAGTGRCTRSAWSARRSGRCRRSPKRS